MTMEDPSNRGKGGLLKQNEVAFAREPVTVPAGNIPARPPAADRAEPDADGRPEVRLHRAEDGTVRAITVRCPCGREVTLQCEYLDDGGKDEQ